MYQLIPAQCQTWEGHIVSCTLRVRLDDDQFCVFPQTAGVHSVGYSVAAADGLAEVLATQLPNLAEGQVLAFSPHKAMQVGDCCDIKVDAEGGGRLLGMLRSWSASRGAAMTEVACSVCGWTQPAGRHADHGTAERPGNADYVDVVMPLIGAHIAATGHPVAVTSTSFWPDRETERTGTLISPRVGVE